MEYECERFEDLELKEELVEGVFFRECTFVKCRFYELKIKNCTFRDCVFEDCTILSCRFQYTDASGNGFRRCTLVGMDWTQVLREKSAALPFLHFDECTLKYNSFYHLKLRKFDFSGCDLSGSFFEGCEMAESKFRDAELQDTAFTDNNLMGADFRQARNYALSVENNRLKKARFLFPEAVNLLTASGIIVE